jgi:hypothetical protein
VSAPPESAHQVRIVGPTHQSAVIDVRQLLNWWYIDGSFFFTRHGQILMSNTPPWGEPRPFTRVIARETLSRVDSRAVVGLNSTARLARRARLVGRVLVLASGVFPMKRSPGCCAGCRPRACALIDTGP